MSPTTVYPLPVHPDKILADQHDDYVKSTMTPSTSLSSRLSSFSTVSLALSISSFSLGSDGEGYNSSTPQSSKKKKKKSKKDKEQQQRCLCYLEAIPDQEQDHTQQAKVHSQQPLSRFSAWYPQKPQKETSRLRKMWNDSTIFHWSKQPASKARHQPSLQQPLQQQLPQQYQNQRQDQEVMVQGLHFGQRTHLAGDMNGVPMRNSLSGTDMSDEGNHTLTDAEDEDDTEPSSTELNHHVSLHDRYGPKTRAPRPGDDLKAISRHQAELNQQLAPADYSDYRLTDVPAPQENRPLASTFVEEEEDEDEDWDIHSDNGAPSSCPMYSAEAKEPTSYSTVTLPLSPPTKSYLRKPSSTNLNTLRNRQRGMSLPADTPLPGFRTKSSSPRENWDEDFEGDMSVPTEVAENQISLQMDMYNIKDFALHIEDLKSLRASLRVASSSLKASNPTKHKDLSMLFQRDWEQAEVIIDLGEIAQTSTSSSAGPLAAGPLSLPSGKGSKSSISRASSQRSRRPALSTTGGSAPAPAALPMETKARSLSQSSTLTGTTIAGSSTGGDSETDMSSSRASSRSSSGTGPGIELTVENLAISQSERRRPYLGSGVEPLQQASLVNDSSDPAILNHCSTPITPLPRSLRPSKDMYEDIDEDPREFNYSLNEFEPNGKWKHGKEDSSDTFKAMSSELDQVQAEIDASLRRYQKYGQHSKKRSGNQKVLERSYNDDDDDGDDGYESYGSIGVTTPIPTDRHMQVLKDILMEGLGSDVARQYMFKHGEQDHVRFSVEVIPGLLGHLKGLQQRLGDQLMELQQLAVVV
ncbi:hypothetical protein BGX31_000977 [Mortierella sp. GBA43]|nr:hypothetical protein BGX31_000977 [Mortierella sp. GBA43]